MKTEDKLKVLMVHNFYKLGGGENTVFNNEKKLLEDNGHKVIVYTRDNKDIDGFNMFQMLALPFKSIFSFKTYRDVKKIIKVQNIDIVHVHNTLTLISPSVFYAGFACKTPVVQTVHNFRMLCPNGLFYRGGMICEECVKFGLNRAIKYNCYRDSRIQSIVAVLILKIHRCLGTNKKVNFICLTDFNKNKLLELNHIGKKQCIDENKVFVKPNFSNIKIDIVSKDKRKNQFVFASRLEKSKGIDVLLKAWAEINESELIVCGTGPLEEWCKEFVSDNNIDNIKFKGFMNHTSLLRIISESKALILPSQWYEGFPMTIVESIACGTPVIGCNIGNVGYLIRKKNAGCTFHSSSQEDLIKAIKEFCIMNYDIDSFSKLLSREADNYYLLNSIYSKIQGVFENSK